MFVLFFYAFWQSCKSVRTQILLLIHLKRFKGETGAITQKCQHMHYKYTLTVYSFYRYIHCSSIIDEYKCTCCMCTCRAAGQRRLAVPDAVHHADNATIWPCHYKVLKWMDFLFLKLCTYLSRNPVLDLLLYHEKPVLKKNENCFKMNEREFLCW